MSVQAWDLTIDSVAVINLVLAIGLAVEQRFQLLAEPPLGAPQGIRGGGDVGHVVRLDPPRGFFEKEKPI